MVTPELLAYVSGTLPPPPLRVLEIGAGDGRLARTLTELGYEVTAIDPAAETGGLVEPIPLIEASGAFDAAVAIVSLHHIDPLEESFARLATLLPAGGLLVIDELDADRYDERAARWWLAQRRAVDGPDPDADHEPADLVRGLHEHVHSLDSIYAALEPWFELGSPVRGPYLYRWKLGEALYPAELELIGSGQLPAIGCRVVAIRRGDAVTAP